MDETESEHVTVEHRNSFGVYLLAHPKDGCVEATEAGLLLRVREMDDLLRRDATEAHHDWALVAKYEVVYHVPDLTR